MSSNKLVKLLHLVGWFIWIPKSVLFASPPHNVTTHFPNIYPDDIFRSRFLKTPGIAIETFRRKICPNKSYLLAALNCWFCNTGRMFCFSLRQNRGGFLTSPPVEKNRFLSSRILIQLRAKQVELSTSIT